MSPRPAVVFLFSGKRKSGKDHITNILHNRLGDQSILLRLSGPLKSQYAKEHNLDCERLLDSSEYKEKYRLDMIKWGEEMRAKDHEYFCKLAIQQNNAYFYPIWIVTDVRRKTDIRFFHENFYNATILVRVEANDVARTNRGWTFTPGVDNVESELDLDENVTWDYIIHNNGDDEDLEKSLQRLVNEVDHHLHRQSFQSEKLI